METDCHLVREKKIQNAYIRSCYVPSTEQHANIYIKALGRDHFPYLSNKSILSAFMF